MPADPYSRAYWRNTACLLNERTIDMLLWMEKRTGLTLYVGQGSYKGHGGGSGVGASGSTHDGGGAVDLSIRWYKNAEQRSIVRAGKDAGFALWHRPPNWDGKGGSEHAHGIAIGDKEMSGSAAWQVREYLAGRTGLTSARVDNSYRPDPQVEWSTTLKAPVAKGTKLLWDGIVPPIENVEKAEDEGVRNTAAYRLAARLHDLGFYSGTPINGAQGYPSMAVVAWQRSKGYAATGKYGPIAHRKIFDL